MTWCFQELQSENILQSWMHFYITFQLPHDVHGATRVTQRSFLQSKSSSNRSFAHGVLLGGKVRGPIDRRSWTSLIIHYFIIIQQWHGSNIGNPLKQGKMIWFFEGKTQWLDVNFSQLQNPGCEANSWRRRSQTFFPGVKWWGHPRCSISVTWWPKGWPVAKHHVVGHDV